MVNEEAARKKDLIEDLKYIESVCKGSIAMLERERVAPSVVTWRDELVALVKSHEAIKYALGDLRKDLNDCLIGQGMA